MNNISRKRISIILIVYAVIFNFIGGSLAYLSWETNEEQSTKIVFSLDEHFECAANAGGNITGGDVLLAPALCTSEKNAIKRELTVSPTIFGDINVNLDLWLEINSIADELKNTINFRYALTTSDTSCTDNVVVSGSFYGKEVGSTVELLKRRTYTATINETYYLYIWLDAAETSLETANKSFNFSLNGSCTDDPTVPDSYTYTISYNTGGYGYVDSQDKIPGTDINLTDEEPVREGYAFLGWNTASDGSGTSYQSGDTYSGDNSLNLYAIWGEIYTLCYDANGGSGAPECQEKIEGVELTLSSTNPTRDDYVFGGWALTSTATEGLYGSGDAYNLDGNKTLYAVWSMKENATCPTITSYEGTYDGNAYSITVTGGSGGTIQYSTDNSTWSTTNPSITTPGTLTTYVKMEGDDTHNTVPCGSATVTIEKAPNSIAVTASQSWSTTFSTSAQTKTVTAATSAQGDVTYAIQSQKNASGTAVSYFSISSTTVTMAASTPVGTYTVVIRATAAGNTNYNSGYKDIKLTVTVAEAANTISVTAKGGTYSGTALALVTTSNAQGDVYYSTSTALTSSNYSTSGTKNTIPTGSPASGSTSTTFTVYYYTPGNTNYAAKSGSVTSIKVTRKSYTISYNANGGSGAPSSQTKYYGINLTLSSTKPTKTGYTFLGWSTSSTATSATYAAGGSYTTNAAATLYAVWQVNATCYDVLSSSGLSCNESPGVKSSSNPQVTVISTYSYFVSDGTATASDGELWYHVTKARKFDTSTGTYSVSEYDCYVVASSTSAEETDASNCSS